MGTTYYHSVNGRITGQTKDGVKTHFLTDPLGSVTATLSDAGVEENTYRYKPYGGLLSKAGSAEDPAFLWLGGLGYRDSMPGAKYVRRRTLVSSIGSWSSCDPMWPIEPAYVYANSSPSMKTDASGLGNCENQMVKSVADCYARNVNTGVRKYFKAVWCNGDNMCDRCDGQKRTVCSMWFEANYDVKGYDRFLTGKFRSGDAGGTCAGSGITMDILKGVLDKFLLLDIYRFARFETDWGKVGIYTDCTLKANYWITQFSCVGMCRPGCSDPCDKSQCRLIPGVWPDCHKKQPKSCSPTGGEEAGDPIAASTYQL